MPANRFPLVWRLCGCGLIVAVIVLSLLPNVEGPQLPQGDKLNHFLAYAVLMNWFGQIDRSLRRRVIWAGALIGLGIAIEFAQGASGLRMYEPADMVADAIGVAAGWLIAPPRGWDLYRRLTVRFSPSPD